MILIKQYSDLLNKKIDDELYPLLEQRYQFIKSQFGDDYDPEMDGYLICFDQAEDLSNLISLGIDQPIRDLIFEQCDYHAKYDCYELLLIMGDSFGLIFILPDVYLMKEMRELVTEIADKGGCNG